MKKQALVFSLILFIAVAPVIAFADNIRVTPVGELHTGMAIITGSPASLETYATNGKTIEDVWLMFIIDEDTYTNLNTITITGTEGPSSLSKSDFSHQVPPPARIPEASDTHYKSPPAYPGCKTPQTNYQVSAILSQMGQVYPQPTSVRYVLVFAFSSVDGTPKPFTVTIESPHINVLTLAQGKDGETTKLNENSPFSGSTLVVPEPATVLAALASFAAFAVYAGKRRKARAL